MQSKRTTQLVPVLMASLESGLSELVVVVGEKVREVESLAHRMEEVVEKKKQWLALSLQDPGTNSRWQYFLIFLLSHQGRIKERRTPPPQGFDPLPNQRVLRNAFLADRLPWAPIYTNFEGERAPKKRIFLSKFSNKCPKKAFLTCFFKNLPAAQKVGKFGQNCVFLVP